jgi:hypothetical protein
VIKFGLVPSNQNISLFLFFPTLERRGANSVLEGLESALFIDQEANEVAFAAIRVAEGFDA